MRDYIQLATELLLFLKNEKSSKNDEIKFVQNARKKISIPSNSNEITKSQLTDLISELSDHEEVSFKEKINDIWQMCSDNIQSTNKDNGLTQSGIADRVGITKQALSKILSFGTETIPKKYTLIRIALAFELTYRQTVELLAYGNYAFNPGKAIDKIIIFCINKGIYDINEIYRITEIVSKEQKIDFIGAFKKEIQI